MLPRMRASAGPRHLFRPGPAPRLCVGVAPGWWPSGVAVRGGEAVAGNAASYVTRQAAGCAVAAVLRAVHTPEDLAAAKELLTGAPLDGTVLVKVGGDIVQHEGAALAEGLLALQALGLSPVVVHGAGPQMNAELEARGVEPTYVNGSRVTDKDTLHIANRVFNDVNVTLSELLEARGGAVKPLPVGTFQGVVAGSGELGFVGDVRTVDTAAVEEAIADNRIPVLTSLGVDLRDDSPLGVLNINADVAARELALALGCARVVFVSAGGGWKDESGAVQPQLVMSRDYAALAAKDYTGRQGTLLKLNEVKALLDGLPAGSSVSICAATDLASQVLPGRGPGTQCSAVEPQSAGTTASGGGGGGGGGGSSKTANHPVAAGPPMKVGLMGARGYVARELLRLFERHGGLQVTVAGSRAFAGRPVTAALGIEALPHAVAPGLTFEDVSPEALRSGAAPDAVADVDVWVLALPNGLCAEYAAAVDGVTVTDAKVLDLSADQRFDTTGMWVYGMPELRPAAREALRGARFISNPGCYATAAALGLAPLAATHALTPLIPPHVFGVSGYSGAGTTPSPRNDPAFLADNLAPYSLANHIHEREVGRVLGTRICFSPHVAPWFQGISATITAHVADPAAHTQLSVQELYEATYADEPLVTVLPDGTMPDVKTHGTLSHGVTIGGFTYEPSTGRLTFVAVIDNLLKGAATQALQNINLATGLEELQGIV